MPLSVHRSPALRFLVLALAYAVTLAASLVVSLLLRFDLSPPKAYWRDLAVSAAWILPLKLALLGAFGQFRTLLTFFSIPDTRRLGSAMAVAALLCTGAWFLVQGQGIIPRGVILIDFLVSFSGLVALRTGMRLYRERRTPGLEESGRRRRWLVIGAGKVGAALCQEIQSRPGLGAEVVAFLDDDPAKIGGTLHTKPVLGPLTLLPEVCSRLNVQKIVIAMPSARPALIKSLVQQANSLALDHDIMPSMAQMLEGRVKVSQLRHVEPQDLLGRPPAELDEAGIAGIVEGAVIMVTGAGGSIGAELCRQIAAKHPGRLLLVERSEAALFTIHEELAQAFPLLELEPLATDAGNEERMTAIFDRHRPSLVLHAAAHKHVPLMERQPAEAFLNNVLATAVVARLAAGFGAAKFILISTDKAVNPTGVMGMTKRIAEMLLQELQSRSPHCAHAAVRFGNVLGSSGSVVPIFHRQIAAGGPVTVTHPEATRYFMSLGEAAGLILQSAWQSRGGEIFLLEMGEPLRINDLARHMIELSGLIPGREIEIRHTGLRPGEKLTEETSHPHEALLPTIHPKVKSIKAKRTHADTGEAIRRLQAELHGLSPEEVIRRLKDLATG